MRQHAGDNKDICALAAALILLQMYMDDVMTSLETEDEEVDVIIALSYLEKQSSRHEAIVLKCYKVSRWKIVWQMLTLKSLSYLASKLWESSEMLK